MKYRITVETITDTDPEDIELAAKEAMFVPEFEARKVYEQTVDHLDIRQVIAAVNPQTQPAMVIGSQQIGWQQDKVN